MNQQKFKIIWILGSISIILVIFMLGFFYEWIWILWLPISFGVVAAYQALSEHFMSTQRRCPRCGTANNIQNNFCLHCGFKFVIDCPSCHEFNTYDMEICSSCGKKLNPQETTSITEDIYTKKINFCPNCGIQLTKSEKNTEICPNCNAPIKKFL